MTTKKKVSKKKKIAKKDNPDKAMNSGDHTEKANEAKAFKRAVVEGKDAVILINIFSPDSPAVEFKVRVPKIIHNCSPPQREPAYIMGVMLGALKRKYGNKVK